jgi:hypothetical protein
MKVLVAITEPISGAALSTALGDDADEAEIMLIAPSLDRSAVRFWVSDADEAVAMARTIHDRTAEQATSEGATDVPGEIAEDDLGAAIKDALVTFSAERVVLFVDHSNEDRDRVDAEALSYELGIPVELHPRSEPAQECCKGSASAR